MKRESKILIVTHYSYLWNFIIFLLDVLPPLIRILIFKFMFKHFGKSSFIDYKSYWRYPSKIIIGDNVSINRGCEFYPSFFIKDTYIKLGNNVVIGPNAVFHSATHDYKRLNLPNSSRSIIVKDNVWIGGNSIILPGVTIGEGTIIGAGSIVSKDIPPWSVVVGNPAKTIRRREIDETLSPNYN